MFIARENELAQLKDIAGRKGTASLIYGKRRVGKTRLIKEAVRCCEGSVIYYECIRDTIKENIDGFVRTLMNERILTFEASFDSFQAVFSYLNSLEDHFIVVIDEFPYLSSLEKQEKIDSIFQSIIDNNLANVSLIISGSQISIMEDMLHEENALYGRFDLVIHLRDLNYLEAAEFYPSKTPYEKAAFYSVFGGSPFVLQQLHEDDTLEENIIRVILNESSPVFLYITNMLVTDRIGSDNAQRILSVLGNSKKRYSDIENSLFEKSTGNLAKQLQVLLSTDLIKQDGPINRRNDAKKRSYEINDNLMRFYYTYVYRNAGSLQMVGPSEFYERTIAPTLFSDFIPRRFEEICRSFFALKARKGELPGITGIGCYYYNDPLRKRNGEFDIALKFGDVYEILEAKYHKTPMTLDEIHREAGQIKEIAEINVVSLGFVSVNGFADREEGYKYYSGEDLYS